MQSYIFSKTHTRWTDLISRHTENIVNFVENVTETVELTVMRFETTTT